MRLRCLPGAHDAGQRAFIGDRQRAIALAGGTREQLFGDRSTALETEGRQAVQFGVAGQFAVHGAVHGGSAEPAVQHPRRMRIVALTEGPAALAVCGFHHVVVAACVGLVPPARFDPLRPGDDAQARVTQRLWGVQQPAGRSGQYDGGLAAGWVPLARSGRWSACTASGCTASSPSRARRRSRSWFQGIACAGRVSNRSRAAGTNGGNCSACRRSARLPAGRVKASMRLRAISNSSAGSRSAPAGRWSARWPAAGRARTAGRSAARRHRANTGTRPGPAAGGAAGTTGPGWIRFRTRIRCVHRNGPVAGSSAGARWVAHAMHPAAAARPVRSAGPGCRAAVQVPRPACAGRNGQAR